LPRQARDKHTRNIDQKGRAFACSQELWEDAGLSDEALLAMELPQGVNDAADDARNFYGAVHKQAEATAQQQQQQQQQHEQQGGGGGEDEFGADFLSDDVLLSMVP
jgi:hypothetical protein